jgi:hypothetical protein
MTIKSNTQSFENKYSEHLWIAVYSQSTTVTKNIYAGPPMHNNIRHATLLQKLPED